MDESGSGEIISDELTGRWAYPEKIALILSQGAMIGIIIMVMAEVFTRKLLNLSLGNTDEISCYLLVGLFFLSLAATQTTGSFHKVELVQDRLSVRGKLMTRLLFETLNLAACLILLWYLTRFVFISWQRGDTSMSQMIVLWIPRIVMPIGVLLLCYAIVRSMIGLVRNYRSI